MRYDNNVSISASVLKFQEKENLPKPMFQRATEIDELDEAENFQPVASSTQKEAETPYIEVKPGKKTRKLKNVSLSSDEEDNSETAISKTDTDKINPRKKRATLNSDEEATGNQNSSVKKGGQTDSEQGKAHFIFN